MIFLIKFCLPKIVFLSVGFFHRLFWSNYSFVFLKLFPGRLFVLPLLYTQKEKQSPMMEKVMYSLNQTLFIPLYHWNEWIEYPLFNAIIGLHQVFNYEYVKLTWEKFIKNIFLNICSMIFSFLSLSIMVKAKFPL